MANLTTEDLFRWTNISPETALAHFLKYTMELDNRPFFWGDAASRCDGARCSERACWFHIQE